MLPFLLHRKTNAANNSKLKSNKRPKYLLMLLLPFFAVLAQAPFVAVRAQIPISIVAVTGVNPGFVCTSPNPTIVGIHLLTSLHNPGNVFIAQLSNASGSFATPTVIGTDTATTANLIVAKIPSGLTPGAGYLIRIASTNPNVPQYSIPVPFAVSPNAAPTLTLTTQDVSSCGVAGKITGTATGGLAPYAFGTFNPNGSITNAPGGVSVPLTPGLWGMGVRDANGCTVSDTVTLVQVAAPTIEVSTKGNVSSCGTGGGFFTLRVFPRTGTIATAIKPFSFQEVPQTTDTTGVAYAVKPVPVTFSNLAEGTYKVRMKDGAGCVSNFLQNIAIGTDGPLTIALSGWGNPTSCAGTDGDITVLNSGGSGSTYRYSISSDGGATWSTPQSGRRFGGLGAGTYTIQGMDSRGCTATLTKTLSAKGCATIASSTDGLRTATALNALKLQALPNPSRTTFTLNLQGSSTERVQIIVTDMLGKKVYQTIGSSNRQYTFGQEFKSGIYLVQVIQGKQIQTLKLVKIN